MTSQPSTADESTPTRATGDFPADSTRTMRAVRYHEFGSADVLEVDEVTRPTPDRDEVLVEMRAASVNRVDVMFRTGKYGEIPLPSVPGGDGAGVVAAVGEDVDRFEPGDRVVASGMDRAAGGTFAEYAAIPETKLAALPADVSFAAAAALANVGVAAWLALEELAGIQAGDRVLVHGGSGGVGHAAVQIAASSGADVFATAGTEAARERVRELGATAAFDYESDSLAVDILAASDGEGVETVLDHRLEDYLDLDLDVVADGGQIISTMGHVPATDGRALYEKEVTIQGLRTDSRPVRTPVLKRLLRLVERGDLSGVVADTYDFDEVASAHRDLLAGGYVGKLVVVP